jgi:tetratricopeptide (TPR) repeat protein
MPPASGPEPDKGEPVAEAPKIPVAESSLQASLVFSEVATPPPVSGEQTILVASAPQPSATDKSSEALLHARQLIDQGQEDQARSFLQNLVDQAQALLAHIPERAPTRLSSIHPRSRRALARAQQMIKEGQYEEAVRESHLAWQDSKDSPDIFEQMIDIHCRAAMANTSPEGYKDAIRWLMCANGHDQSDARVQQALADRHYLQAKQLVERGRRRDALEALKQCLAWNPDHTQARELQQTLMRR